MCVFLKDGIDDVEGKIQDGFRFFFTLSVNDTVLEGCEKLEGRNKKGNYTVLLEDENSVYWFFFLPPFLLTTQNVLTISPKTHR